VITYLGPNNDTLLFTNYLNAGGSLFLQGEHHELLIRDTNLFFVHHSVASSPTYPAEQLRRRLHRLHHGRRLSRRAREFQHRLQQHQRRQPQHEFPRGHQQRQPRQRRPIGANVAGAYGGAMNTALAWLPGDLKTNGRLVVSFESNATPSPPSKTPPPTPGSRTPMTCSAAACAIRFPRSFNPPNICIGQSGSFDICYHNTGSRSMTNMVVSDTLPGCISYNSSSPAATGSSGNLRWWNIGTVAAGASACVTVNYTASSMPPCP